MGEIRCKNSNGTYYLTPGKAITSIPIFGGTSASFDPSSPATATVNATYTYINKIVKGSNASYYFSNISAPFIKNLYASKAINFNGTTTNLLYRRYTKTYYGFVTGTGGSRGGSNSYMADERTGGGGGGAGSCIFLFSVASDTTPTFTASGGSLTVTCDGYTIVFTGNNGGGGSSGSGACTGKGGSGGGGGGASMKLGDTTHSNNTNYYGQYGPFYIVAVITSGTGGAGGGTWGDRGDAADKSLSFTAEQCAALGIPSGSISWSRADGQNGSSAAPGVTSSGSTSWYGSGGGQSATAKYWEYSYSLE